LKIAHIRDFFKSLSVDIRTAACRGGRTGRRPRGSKEWKCKNYIL